MSRRYKNLAAPVPALAPVTEPQPFCRYNESRTKGTAYDANGKPRVDFRVFRGSRGRVVEIQAGDVIFKNL